MKLGECMLRLFAARLKAPLPGEPPKDPILRKVWDSMERRGLDPRPLADWDRLERRLRR